MAIARFLAFTEIDLFRQSIIWLKIKVKIKVDVGIEVKVSVATARDRCRRSFYQILGSQPGLYPLR